MLETFTICLGSQTNALTDDKEIQGSERINAQRNLLIKKPMVMTTV